MSTASAIRNARAFAAGQARIAGRRVVVDYVNPPIPIRDFDFCAVFEGHDIGDPQGYGNTAAEAIEDLHDKATGEQA